MFFRAPLVLYSFSLGRFIAYLPLRFPLKNFRSSPFPFPHSLFHVYIRFPLHILRSFCSLFIRTFPSSLLPILPSFPHAHCSPFPSPPMSRLITQFVKVSFLPSMPHNHRKKILSKVTVNPFAYPRVFSFRQPPFT